MTQITTPATRIIPTQSGLNTQVIVSEGIPSVRPGVTSCTCGREIKSTHFGPVVLNVATVRFMLM